MCMYCSLDLEGFLQVLRILLFIVLVSSVIHMYILNQYAAQNDCVAILAYRVRIVSIPISSQTGQSIPVSCDRPGGRNLSIHHPSMCFHPLNVQLTSMRSLRSCLWPVSCSVPFV